MKRLKPTSPIFAMLFADKSTLADFRSVERTREGSALASVALTPPKLQRDRSAGASVAALGQAESKQITQVHNVAGVQEL